MKPIGEILIEQGAITRDQLKKALDEQNRSHEKKRLGEILIQMGFMTEVDIVVALSTQFNFPYLPLKNVTLNREVYKIVPLELIHRHHFVPVDKINDILTIVTADPSNEKVIAEIAEAAKCKVQVLIATLTEVEQAIRQHFEKGKSLPKEGKGS